MFKTLVGISFAILVATEAISIDVKQQKVTQRINGIYEIDVTFNGDIALEDKVMIYMQYPARNDSVVFDVSRIKNMDDYFTGFNADQEQAQLIVKDRKSTNEPHLIAGTIFVNSGSTIFINTRQNHTYWMRETFWSENYHTDGVVVSPGDKNDSLHTGNVGGDLVSSTRHQYQSNKDINLDRHKKVDSDGKVSSSISNRDAEDGYVDIDLLVAYTEAAMVRCISVIMYN